MSYRPDVAHKTGRFFSVRLTHVTRKLFIKTYGCQMNTYDSARMADVMAPHGYALVDLAGRRGHGGAEHVPYPREGGGEGLLRAWPVARTEAKSASAKAGGWLSPLRAVLRKPKARR